MTPTGSGSRRAARLFAYATAAAIAFVLAVVPEAFFAILAGVLLAILLKTIADAIATRTRLSYPVALALVVTTGLAGTGLVLGFAGPRFAAQVPGIAHEVRRALGGVQGLVQRWAGGKEQISAGAVQPVAAGVLEGVRGAASLVAGLVVAMFVGLYGAANPEPYKTAALSLVHPEHRARAEGILADLERRLGRWMIGRLFAMTSVGVATAIGLHLIGIPLAFSLGVLAGVLTFIEYIGAISSAVPPVLLAFTESPVKAAWVIVLFTGIHVVEGYLLTPLIVRTAVRLSPAFTIAVQVLFGALFGIIGLTFASPMVIIAVALVQKLYVEGTLAPPETPKT